MHCFGSDDFPDNRSSNLIRSVAGEFDDILAAILLNLDGIIFDLSVDHWFSAVRIDLKISDGGPYDKACAIGDWTFCKAGQGEPKRQN
jgi:hypothetical protein